MRLVRSLSVVALLGGTTPAFADGDVPPPPPATDMSTTTPAAPPPAAEPPPTTGAPGSPDADGGADFRPRPMRRDIVITVPGDRTPQNIAMVAGIAAAGAVLGGIGVYYNLDSKSAAESVSPKHPTNTPWTPDDQATYDRAHSSAIKAGVFYGLGGAVLIGAIVTLIVTAPASETTVIHPHYAKVQPLVAPTPNGAMIGGAWRF